MAQADTRKANILAYLHLRVVRGVLRRLLEYCVSRQNNEWTIDHFIYHHTRRINGTVIGRENERHLFPGFHVNANVDSWPLYLFPFLIVDIADSGTLSEDITNIVRQLNESKIELYSRIVLGISDEHVRNLRLSIEYICEFLHSAQLNEEADIAIRNAVENMDVPDDIDYVQDFNVCQETAKSYRQRVTGFTQDQQRLHDFIQQHAHSVHHHEEEAAQQEGRNGRIVSIRDERHFDDLEAAERQGHDLNKPFLPPRPDLDRYAVTLPEIPIEIDIRGCTPPQNQRISELIVNTINDVSVSDIKQENREIIKNAFGNAITSFGEYRARQGCIQLLVQPNTIQDVFKLLNECINGVLTNKLKPVQDLIRTFPGCEIYEQEVVLYKENYDCVMDSMAKQLMKELELKGYRSAPKRKVTVEDSNHGTLLLNVVCYSPEDRSAFKNAVLTGQLKPTFDVLEQQLKRVFPDVSLSTRLIENAEDLNISAEQPKITVLRIKPNVTSKRTQMTFLRDIDVTLSSDKKIPSVTGFSVNSTGRIIAADLANKCIKLIDTSTAKCIGTPIPTCCTPYCGTACKRDYRPWDATAIDDNQAVVSVPAASKLIFVETRNDQLSIVKELKSHKQCRGLAYCCGHLYVTYGSPESKVSIMNTDGKELQTFSNKYISEPWYVAVNANDKSIFITETMKKCVIRLDSKGTPVQIMDLKQLSDGPRGIALLDLSNVLLCAYRYSKTDVLYEINVDSGDSNIVVDEDLTCPDCIHIDRFSGQIFVSMCENKKLVMYKLKIAN